MFNQGDLIRDKETGAEATFQYMSGMGWPNVLAIANWPNGVELADHPGHRGVPYRQCELVRRGKPTVY